LSALILTTGLDYTGEDLTESIDFSFQTLYVDLPLRS